MAKEKDITGLKFNHLTAIRRIHGYMGRPEIYWEFECDCEPGKKTIAIKSAVMRGRIKSCGCVVKNESPNHARKHGGCYSKLYHIWQDMRRRCYDPKRKDYKNYGARGITVCPEWLGRDGFSNFQKWSFANGFDENAAYGKCTIDRKDNNSGYSQQNCHWTDLTHQANNRRNNHRIEAFGENHTLAEWSRIRDINQDLLWKYLAVDKMNPCDAILRCEKRRANANGEA